MKLYERLPQWIRWVLLLPLAVAFVVLTTLARQGFGDYLDFLRPAVAIVSFAAALYALAPKRKDTCVLVSLVTRMILAVGSLGLLAITGRASRNVIWPETIYELLGWVVGWSLYLFAFKKDLNLRPSMVTVPSRAGSAPNVCLADARENARAPGLAEKMWRKILSSDDPDVSLVPRDEVDDIVALLTASRTDPELFAGNMQALLTGRLAPTAFESASGQGQSFRTTPSIGKYLFSFDQPPMVPSWFLAGFPDVFTWFLDKQAALTTASTGEDAYWQAQTEAYTTFLGLPLDSVTSSEPDTFQAAWLNKDGRIRARYWRHLVDSYVATSGQRLEASVELGSQNDMYLAAAIFEAMGEENNCTLIASLVTKYYLELKRSYGSSLPDETSSLAMAGMIDGWYYISLTRQVTPLQVVAAAQDTAKMQNRLLEFILRFEALILSCDNPELTPEEVRRGCLSERQSIESSIDHTTLACTAEAIIVNTVRMAMSSPEYEELRKASGALGG